MQTQDILYFDYMASTPMCEAALQTYNEVATSLYGNPSGVNMHSMKAREAVREAEGNILRAVGLNPEDKCTGIWWAGSATLATRELVACQRSYTLFHPSTVEHKCVLQAIEDGVYMVTTIPVTPSGVVDVDRVTAEILATSKIRSPRFVSVMHVNNETGAINNIEAIGQAVSQLPGTVFHVDACQSFGKLPIDMKRSCIDFLTVSGHKIYGPKGIGGIIYNSEKLCSRLNRHSRGTVNSAGILAFEAAHRWCSVQYSCLDWGAVQDLRELFINELAVQIPSQPILISPGQHSVPWCINLHLPTVDTKQLLVDSSNISFSTGSSCNSGSFSPSHVLKAMGYDRKFIDCCARFSFDPISTTDAIIKEAIYRVAENVNRQST